MTVTFRQFPKLPSVVLSADKWDLHLWLASLLQPPHLVADLKSLLSLEEIERANCFDFADDRRRYIVAHGLLRRILGAYQRQTASSLRFAFGPYGKPRLTGGDLHFNLAHSGEFVLFGLSRRDELGVDLEAIRVNARLGLVDYFFAPSERSTLRALPVGERTEAFYTTWTRKEAFIKATGHGLTQRLDQFEVTVGSKEPPRFLHLDGHFGGADAWSLYDLRPSPDLVGAVAIRANCWRVTAWRMSDISSRIDCVTEGTHR